MDSELYSMLNLYKSKNRALSVQDVMLLMDSTDTEVWPPIKNLFDSGYLHVVGGYVAEDGSIAVDTKLRITYAGELALRESTRSKKNHFWIELRAWATLAIALIALFVSIASVLLQSR